MTILAILLFTLTYLVIGGLTIKLYVWIKKLDDMGYQCAITLYTDFTDPGVATGVILWPYVLLGHIIIIVGASIIYLVFASNIIGIMGKTFKKIFMIRK